MNRMGWECHHITMNHHDANIIRLDAMNIIEYTPLAVKTKAPYREFVMDPSVFDLVHSTMGLITEIVEYMNAGENKELTIEQHKLEELGDIIWYLAVGHSIVKGMVDSHARIFRVMYMKEKTINGMLGHAGEMMDVCKRHIYYKKDFDFQRFAGDLDCCFVIWHELAGDEASNITTKNIAKLAKRYGDKFDPTILRNYGIEAEVFKC